MPLADASSDPLLGRMVGSYRLARLIGQGGMGQVYLGVQPSIDSRVAVKVLSTDCARSPALVERFFAEARAVNVIRHDNIVSVLDLAALPDGRPYVVMEYLDGLPVSGALRLRGPMPLGTLTELTVAVLDALGAAHAKGIVHRDMKPDNVFLTSSGRVKLLDFGIAKLKPEIVEFSDATREGSLVGTPHYMSPEQARGQPVDGRTDLYSVGLIMFEAATGQRAFTADSLYDLLRLHIEQPPRPPRELRPDMPVAFENVILRALEKDPATRFQSAREFALALEQAAPSLPPSSWMPLAASSASTVRPLASGAPRGAPTPLSPGTTPAPTPATPSGMSHTATGTRPPTRKWTWALVLLVVGAVAALGVGALLVVGGSVWFWSRSQGEKSGAAAAQSAASTATQPSSAETVEPPAAQFSGQYRVAASSMPAQPGQYTGTVTVQNLAEHYAVTWQLPGQPHYSGVGIPMGDLLGVGYSVSTEFGVAMYRVQGGRLTGKWTSSATASQLGKEVLQGPAGLNGVYTIVEAAEPSTGGQYQGSVTIAPNGKNFQVLWNLAGRSRAGVGLRSGDVFVVGWGPQSVSGVVVYQHKGKQLDGVWAPFGTPAQGTEVLALLQL